jgi:hypothetical protein
LFDELFDSMEVFSLFEDDFEVSFTSVFESFLFSLTDPLFDSFFPGLPGSFPDSVPWDDDFFL